MRQTHDHSSKAGAVKTVLQVLPALETGGVERGTIEIARALVESGWRAVVASSGGQLVADLQAVGGVHVELPLLGKSPLTIWRNAARLTTLIRRENIDLVHARSRAPAWSARFATRRCDRPFVTTYHSAYGDHWLKRPYNAVMASGDRVIAISDFVVGVIRERHPIDENRLVRIHRGVDLQQFDPAAVSEARVEALRQSWALPRGQKIMLLPGRLTRWKGQRLAIEALAKLQRTDALLVLAGSDQGRDTYRAALERAAGPDRERVRFVGDCRDMPAAYKLADVVISASIAPEGFGRVSAEGMAMGKPVVASDHGGSQEIVLDGVTGRLFANEDADAMAQALAEMLDFDPGPAARQRAAAHFSTARMCADTLAVYRRLLEPAS